MAWHFEHSANSPASPEAVWQRYVDVAHWNEWSRKGIQWSRLEGTFEVGARGKAKSPGLPAGRFRVTAADSGRLYASETRLPGATLIFELVIERRETGTRISHRAKLSGPLAFLYAPVRMRITQSLPDGVDRLATSAGAGSETAAQVP